MELINITEKNIESEHICCAISDNKADACAASKKEWMKEQFGAGLIFTRLDARGKVFIEYLPAEAAWFPIHAPNYMHINCFWVSGQYKGKGLGKRLLESCITDARAKGKSGLTVLSSAKKMSFLSDPVFLKRNGFAVADRAQPSFELLYLPFEKTAEVPSFREAAKTGTIEKKGLVLYYSHQCPHTGKYVSLISGVAAGRDVKMEVIRFETAAQAQSAPTPCTTYSLFYNGSFVTNEILTEKKFSEFLDKNNL